MLYLTYSGICSDGEASFCNFKNFTKLYQSLEAEIGLVPDHPDIEARGQKMGQYKHEGHKKSCLRLVIEEKTTLLRHRQQNVHAKESSPLY